MPRNVFKLFTANKQAGDVVSVIQPDDETINIHALSCCVHSAFWVTPTMHL